MTAIDALDADGARREQPSLIALLRDVVDDGGSVGFLPPLSADEAREYWEGVAAAVKGGGRLLWVARADGHIVGTVQLDLEQRANGRHRAELIKLMVHTRARR
ncbi:MAG TPA: GNAT family N-acetyltransferase, partial [Methylomirabilota bacterium]|nr:GNAT family N-acetyltransferase [Methylomirabilota bacterium]